MFEYIEKNVYNNEESLRKQWIGDSSAFAVTSYKREEKSALKILIANDDGIQAKGIIELAALAKSLGDVTVVAPKHQCSGMSQRITIRDRMEIGREPSFPVGGVDAWSIDGTPADCVKAGIVFCVDELPDVVFSGINEGENMGFDTAYSGTVGASLEAVMNGIPAVAFSQVNFDNFDVIERYFKPLMERIIPLLNQEAVIYNINFPNCAPDMIQGVRWDIPLAGVQMYDNIYTLVEEDGKTYVDIQSRRIGKDQAQPGTDTMAVLENFISVSILRPIAKPYRPLKNQ